MKVAMAAVADAANISREGKLNILGIFDTIGAAEFPIVHPALAFAFRIVVEFEDQGGEHDLDLSLIDEDNQVIWSAAATVGVDRLAPGELRHMNQVVNLRGVRFERPGRYRFRIRIEGRERPYDAAFQVVQGKPAGGGPGASM